MSIYNDLTNTPKFKPDLLEKLYEQEKYPVHLNINNLVCVLRLYDTIYNYLKHDYINVGKNDSHNRFIIVAFVKTINLTSELIGKTYKKASIKYTDHAKTLIVLTLYKLNEVLMTLKHLLPRMEYESNYISGLLQVSIDKKGTEILDKNSIEAKVYYCYRYFYKSHEVNNYNISSYAVIKNTEVEIYDYYFKENSSKDINDDLFIEKDYKRWFGCEDVTNVYDDLPYDKLEEKPRSFNMVRIPTIYEGEYEDVEPKTQTRRTRRTRM
jgi:hypothetical protein